MAQDLVVKLLLKSGAFSNDIKTAKGQIQSFKANTQDVSNVLQQFGGKYTGIITKIGKVGPWGAAAAAVAGVGKAMIDCGKYTDDLGRITDSVKGVFRSFAYDLGTFNFNDFISNAKKAAEQMKEIYDMMDHYQTSQGVLTPEVEVKRTVMDTAIDTLSAKRRLGLKGEEIKPFVDAAEKAAQEYLEAFNLSLQNEYGQYQGQFASLLAGGYIETFNKLSAEEQKALMTRGASGEWGFNDKYNELKAAGKDAQKAVEPYFELLEKLVALENRAEKKPEILKTLQQMSKLYIMGGNTDFLYNREAASVERRLAGGEKALNTGNIKTAKEIAEEEERIRKEQEEQARLAADAVGYLEDQIKKENEKLSSIKEGTNAWLEQYDAIQKLNKELDETKNKLDIINSRKAEPLAKIDSSKLYSGARAEVQNPTGLAKTSYTSTQKIGIDFSGINKAQEFTSSLQSSAMAVTMLGESLKNLTDNENESADGFEKFINVISMGVNMLNTLSTVMQTINNLTELFGITSQTSAAQKLTSDAASIASTETVVEAEKKSAAERITLDVAVIASKKALAEAEEGAAAKKIASDAATTASTEAAATTQVAANTAVAGSGAASAMASIPWVGPALAAAAALSMVALLATSLPKFATGGIVGGNSFTGDRVLAGVNSGEMILNKSQQSNLWRQINSNVGGNNQVEFHISGTELVGVLNNNNRKSRLVR